MSRARGVDRRVSPRVRFVRLAMVAIAASTLVARATLAQAGGLDALRDNAAREMIRVAVAKASAKGVPTAPMLTKLQEGMAKQAPASRIAEAVQQLGLRLEAANEALAVAVSADEVAAGAAALQVGVGAGVLRDLRTRWTTAPLTVPLGVMTQMVASGVSVARAAAQVRLLLDRGATATQLVALTAAVQADIAAGIAPDVAFTLRVGGVSVSATAVSPPLTNTTPPGAPPIRPRP